jgi:hypothetical protein
MNVMTQFHSKAQRKMVMRLVKQHSMNEKHALRGKSEPYPNLHNRKNNLSEDDQDIFMKKAFFKGDKGMFIPKMVKSGRFDKDGKPYYKTSMLSTRRHLVKGKGDFRHVEKYDSNR